ncbi:MAG: TlyA family rRNA (cytidine-2'-O)-methyltransferase [Chloroflexota bacterium]|nr:MAG: TlyA family rRNA (cytidine-2'-O)-methyltransferase [Chloroflexota bacterium]
MCYAYGGMGRSRIRLDVLLAEKGVVESRNRAQALIMAGKVRVDGQVMTKPGVQVPGEAAIIIEQDLPYVSRGGLKLAAALDEFTVDPIHAICADVGASTGGFTDVLLQRGAARIYAIDVGYGQLDWKLRQDERVVVMERTNARYLEALPEPVNLVTIDASFISLKLILPVVKKWLTTPGLVVALIKPQFEAGQSQVGKGGVVRDRMIHRQVLANMAEFAVNTGFKVLGLALSPITGPAGNHEFFLRLGWQTAQPSVEIAASIEACLAKLEPAL